MKSTNLPFHECNACLFIIIDKMESQEMREENFLSEYKPSTQTNQHSIQTHTKQSLLLFLDL